MIGEGRFTRLERARICEGTASGTCNTSFLPCGGWVHILNHATVSFIPLAARILGSLSGSSVNATTSFNASARRPSFAAQSREHRRRVLVFSAYILRISAMVISDFVWTMPLAVCVTVVSVVPLQARAHLRLQAEVAGG